jgi:hypothetical protein
VCWANPGDGGRLEDDADLVVLVSLMKIEPITKVPATMMGQRP